MYEPFTQHKFIVLWKTKKTSNKIRSTKSETLYGTSPGTNKPEFSKFKCAKPAFQRAKAY